MESDSATAQAGETHEITIESTQVFKGVVGPSNSERLTGDGEGYTTSGVSLDPVGEEKCTYECSCGDKFRKARTARDHLEDVSSDE